MFSSCSLEWARNILSVNNSLLHLRQEYFSPLTSVNLTLPCSTSWCWCSCGLVLKTLTHLLHLKTNSGWWWSLMCSCSSSSLYLEMEHLFMLQANLCTSLKWLSQSACFTKCFFTLWACNLLMSSIYVHVTFSYT